MKANVNDNNDNDNCEKLLLPGGCDGDGCRAGWMLVMTALVVMAVTDALLTSAPLR